jgi:hypothetical protein
MLQPENMKIKGKFFITNEGKPVHTGPKNYRYFVI